MVAKTLTSLSMQYEGCLRYGEFCLRATGHSFREQNDASDFPCSLSICDNGLSVNQSIRRINREPPRPGTKPFGDVVRFEQYILDRPVRFSGVNIAVDPDRGEVTWISSTFMPDRGLAREPRAIGEGSCALKGTVALRDLGCSCRSSSHPRQIARTT